MPYVIQIQDALKDEVSSDDDDDIEVLEHRKGFEPKILGPTGTPLTIKPASSNGLGYFRLLFFIQAFILFRTPLNFIPCMVTQTWAFCDQPPATRRRKNILSKLCSFNRASKLAFFGKSKTFYG